MRDDPADGLMAGNHRKGPGQQVTGDDLQVGPAHCTGGDRQPDLARAGLWIGALHRHQPPVRSDVRHGARRAEFLGDHEHGLWRGIIGAMEWIRKNIAAIVIVVVLAMLMPFLLVLFGIITF
ncbi:MAG: hypothetical protein WCF36_16580 [Candidatus Nanopelagicales bacterium]